MNPRRKASRIILALVAIGPASDAATQAVAGSGTTIVFMPSETEHQPAAEQPQPRLAPQPKARDNAAPLRVTTGQTATNKQPVGAPARRPLPHRSNIRLAARRAAGLKAYSSLQPPAALAKPTIVYLPAPPATQPAAKQPVKPTQPPTAELAIQANATEPTSSKPLGPVTPAVEAAASQDQQAKQEPIQTVAHQAPTEEPKPMAGSLFDRLLQEAHRAATQATTIEDYTAIVGVCDEACQEDPTEDKCRFARQLASWSLNRRGQLHINAGDGEAALTDFLRAKKLDANNWRARHNLGVSLAQNGRFAEAFAEINAVIATRPRFAKAYCNRATLYVQAGSFREALDDYERAILLDGSMITAHVGRGRLCHQEGRLNEALSHFTSALESDPDNAELHGSRADLYADLGRYSEALAGYAKAIEIDPGFGHAYRNGAWLLATCPDQRFRDAENAIDGATEALEMGYGPRHVALDTVAAALACGGYFDEAIEAIDKAIDDAPGPMVEQYRLRRSLYTRGEAFFTRPLAEVRQASHAAE